MGHRFAQLPHLNDSIPVLDDDAAVREARSANAVLRRKNLVAVIAVGPSVFVGFGRSAALQRCRSEKTLQLSRKISDHLVEATISLHSFALQEIFQDPHRSAHSVVSGSSKKSL